MNATPRPSATGTSMPMRRARRLRQAPAKNGPAANSSTGKVSSQAAQASRRWYSGVISPGAARYDGSASIMICVAHSPATNRRHNAARASILRAARAAAAVSGVAR